MNFDNALQQGQLIRRYKRFLADVRLADGSVITIHCPNTGSMKHCDEAGRTVWFSESHNKKRKYPHTWQLIEVEGGFKVGINTGLANKLAVEAIDAGRVSQLQGYRSLRTEVAYGKNSRIDILLQDKEGDRRDCYIEVKNVTLGMGDGEGLFPDAVTSRGQKHLRELMQMVDSGARAVMFFCVQHEGIERVAPADAIDPEYGRLLRQAQEACVEVLAYRAAYEVSASQVVLQDEVPVLL